MEGIIHDLRFGVRTLWRNPGFTLVVVVTLALGLGVNAAMIGVTVNALFRQLPFEDPDQVMVLWRDTQRVPRAPFSIPTFKDWRERNRVFEHMALFRSLSVNLAGGQDEPERVRGLMVSDEFGPALQIEPVLGRSFTAEDDRLGAERTVMLGHEIWQHRYGGDHQIIGETIRLNEELYTVIGVLPAGLRQERLGTTSRFGDLWLPIGLFFDRLPSEDRAAQDFEGIARLATGISAENAREDMARVTRELAELFPKNYDRIFLTGEVLQRDQTRSIRPVIVTLLTAVSLVLLITCSNLIGLQLTRNATREPELMTRSALGAGSGQLVRHLLVEGLLLALPGGLLGLAVGQLYLRGLPSLISGVPYIENARIDGVTVVLTLLMAIIVGALISSVPAMQAIRQMQRASISGRGLLTRNVLPQQRLRQLLTAGEVALAVMLLVGAGLMLRTVEELKNQEPGFDADNLLTFRVVLPQAAYQEGFPWYAYFEETLERLGALPGFEDVAVTSLRPMDALSMSIVAAEDREIPQARDRTAANFQIVSPGYFRTMGIPLLEGRDFDFSDDDRQGAELVVVINETLAENLWPNESPLGKLFAFEFLGTQEKPEPKWRRIVGVVGDARYQRLDQAPIASAYGPHTQRSVYFEESPVMTVVARTNGEPHQTLGVLRDEMTAIDPDQPLFDISTMNEILDLEVEQPRVISVLLSSFAALALVLAIVGVYGVIARNVTTRTREIGTRMAFGATRKMIFTAFLRRGLTFIIAGVIVGWLASALLGHTLAHFLYGVKAIDINIYILAGLILAMAATLAMIIPILRATAVHPAEALRYE